MIATIMMMTVKVSTTGSFDDCFIPRRDSAKQRTEGGPIVYLCSIFGLRNVFWTLNLHTVFCLFENLKMFYPPKGLCKAKPNGVHFDSFHFNVVRDGYFSLPKLELSCSLFEILKMFYPPNGQWGPFWFFPFYCGLRWVLDTFKILTYRRSFWNPGNVLFAP